MSSRRHRGQLRKLTREDRRKRREHNERTNRAAKIWTKKHIIRQEDPITASRKKQKQISRETLNGIIKGA